MTHLKKTLLRWWLPVIRNRSSDGWEVHATDQAKARIVDSTIRAFTDDSEEPISIRMPV
jgi:hypothetical protein